MNETSVQARMDVHFKAQAFQLSDNDNAPVLSVELPFKSEGVSFSIQTKLNPGPANVTLSLNDEEYQISQDEQQIFVQSWNQSITCQNLFEDSDRQQTIKFTIPKVTNETRASANISFENKIDRSDFEFNIQVVCPEDGAEFCENGGKCLKTDEDIACNCDGTGFYGYICQHTCTPQSIEIAARSDRFRNSSSMVYLGLLNKNKTGERNGSRVQREIRTMRSQIQREIRTVRACREWGIEVWGEGSSTDQQASRRRLFTHWLSILVQPVCQTEL